MYSMHKQKKMAKGCNNYEEARKLRLEENKKRFEVILITIVCLNDDLKLCEWSIYMYSLWNEI